MPSWNEAVSAVSKQAVMISVKECFGYLVLLGIAIILLVMLSNYRTAVVRLLPRMTAIRIWIKNERKGDPKDSVRAKQ